MKRKPEKRASTGLRAALAGLGLIAGLVMLQPGEVWASVSGGATIFNEATVTYTTPTIPSTTAKGSTTVTVATKANNPFVTVSQMLQTSGENSTVNYTYNIINQSNGINNLSAATLPPTDSQVNAPATNSLSALPALTNMWGGISLDIPILSPNTVKVPAGTLAGLANGTTIAVRVPLTTNVYYYTVANTTTGTLPASGVNEVPATLTLTPVAYAGVAATPLTGALVGGTAGIIIGEYRAAVQTLTTSTLISPNLTGSHVINITATATDASASASYTTKTADFNETTTTVLKSPVFVNKYATPATPAKPGDTITYTIEVTNNSSSATTAASIKDALSNYITYTLGTTTLNGVAIVDGGLFPLTAGLTINTLGQAAGIILPSAGNKAVIVYQVKVN